MHGRYGGAGTLENDEFLAERVGEERALGHVGEEGLARQTTAAATTADRGDAAHHGVLVVVRGRVHTPAREREQVGSCEGHLVSGDELRLGGTAAAHREDDDVAPARREMARRICRYGGLADPLTGPDDRERGRSRPRPLARRFEREVRATVADSRAERDTREREPPGGRHNGLVGKVDRHLRRESLDRRRERGERIRAPHHGNAVGGLVGARTPGIHLLGAPHEHGTDDLDVARQLPESESNDGRVVLAVDERNCAHPHSSSPEGGSAWGCHTHSRASSRSKSATTSGSSNGCFRMTRMRFPSISMML